MKKLTIILILFLLLLLSACSLSEGNIQDKITSPENKTIPIQGKWVIEEKLASSEEEEGEVNNFVHEDRDTYVGKEVLFNKDALVVADDFTISPTFSLKNVNTYDYFLYKYKISPSKLNINSETVQVITSMKNNKLFYEFVRYNDDELLVYIDNSFYKLKNRVEEVSLEEVNRYIAIENDMIRSFDNIELESLDSGILLGIRNPIYDEENDTPDWEYKTIWIRSKNREITICELDKLLVPRKNGFWILRVDRSKSSNSITDKLVAIPQFINTSKNKSSEESIVDNFKPLSLIGNRPTVLKSIQFVGNDYVAVEKTEVDKDNRKTLEIYAIDNIEDEKPIRLSDIIGEDGKFLFNEGSENLQSLGERPVLDESNIGLERKNGHWSLKGRVNYRQNKEELFKDFNIRAIPPETMVTYDEQSVPWDKMIDLFPNAVDIFSSPNKEFIVVATNSELQVYNIEDGEIINPDSFSKIE
ncbi:MAG: hypothetical protein WAQ12_07900, partial [Tissierellaceae bacterium]